MTQDELQRLRNVADEATRLLGEIKVIDVEIGLIEGHGVTQVLNNVGNHHHLFRGRPRMAKELGDLTLAVVMGFLHTMRRERMTQLERMPLPFAGECGSDNGCEAKSDPVCR